MIYYILKTALLHKLIEKTIIIHKITVGVNLQQKNNRTEVR
ncbi:hypothetical protein [Clostridium botulinum]|nr:hypothetical protein [Clostridium botulinum]